MRPGGVAALLAAATVAACSSPVVGPDLGGAARPSAAVLVDQAEASALVSNYRGSRGQGAVTADPALQRAAQAQADAMAAANLLSHTLAGSLAARIAAVDAKGKASVENVSAGYADLRAALGGWRHSPPHDANLLYGPMRRIGVAAATAPGTRYRTFWALVMTD